MGQQSDAATASTVALPLKASEVEASSCGPWLARIMPSDEGELTAQAMENWFQACASDEPFCLELVGTRRDQGFVVRASSREQFHLLSKQFEAQYPQCEILPIDATADLLKLQPGEYAMIGEFGLLQESWMPLKTFSGKALSEAGADPLTGLLAAMETVGSGQRVIAQLALVRASDTWLGADLRKSVEHPLQHERDASAQAMRETPIRSDTEHGMRLLLLMSLIFGGILGYRWYQAHAWLPIGLLGITALFALVGVVCWKLIHKSHPIYDMKMVAEKMAKAGFYCHLRVIVIAREPVFAPSPAEKEREQRITDLKQHQQAHRDRHKILLAQLTILRTQLDKLRNLEPAKQDEILLTRATFSCIQHERLLQQTLAEIERLQASIRGECALQKDQVLERERACAKLLETQKQECTACLTALEVAYRQYTQSSANGLFLKKIRELPAADKKANSLTDTLLALPYTMPLVRILHKGAYSPYVLNSLELAGMFHLPQETSDLPLVRRVTIKHLLASPEIAHQIQHTSAPLPPAMVGISAHRRYRIPVLLPFDALFSHKLAIGMSRSGKTVLMLLLAWAAMQPVRDRKTLQPGIFCIDPHLDYIMDLLKLIAGNPDLTQRVLLLDMTDTEYPVALNPLDASMGFTRDQAVSYLMSSLKEIWSTFWGPRMAYFLNAVCLLLYTLNQQLVAQGKADQQYTLLDINPLLQYKEYALKVLAQLDMSETWHRELLAWWKNTYFTLPANSSFRQEVIMPILSKIGVFNDNQQLRHIVGQPITKAPIHLAVTQGKIILCALSTKDMSDEAVNILGSTLVNLLHSSFRLQQHIPLTKRRKVFCAIDEFHAFSGSQLDRMLTEDAKLGCAMLLATQNLKRLNKIREGLLEIVFSTCQQLFAFRVSAADASMLEEELQERVSQKHIISQPTLHCYARLAMEGYPLQIVSTQLARPASWEENPDTARLVDALVQEARSHYLHVAEVERRYAIHLNQFLDMSAYAAKINREVRGARDNKQHLDAAAQRAQDLRDDQEKSQSTATQADDTPQGSPSSPDLTRSTAPKGSRNHRHRRSRRMGKHPLGSSPPMPPSEDPELESLKRFLIPGGSHWKSSTSEREPRE